MRFPLSAALALSVLSVACSGGSPAGNPKVPAGAKSSGGLHATIDTDKGSIDVELFQTDSPRAVENASKSMPRSDV